MKIKLIACMVLSHETYYLAYKSKNTISIDSVPQELHGTPEKLNVYLQDIINRAEDEDNYDAICFAYGLCSNAAAGLFARETKLVIPKAHDCITLLLGSKERYSKLFEKYDGRAYWYSKGWAADDISEMPSAGHFENLYKKYCEMYDEDSAEYLVEVEKSWIKRYSSAVFISWPGMDYDYEKNATERIAEELELEYIQEEGNDILLKNLIEGNWEAQDFLVVPPGNYIVPSYNEEVLGYSQNIPKVSRDKVMNNPVG